MAKSNDRMFSSPRMFQCPRKFNQEPKYLSPGPKYRAVRETEAGAFDKGAEARVEEGCDIQPSTQVHALELSHVELDLAAPVVDNRRRQDDKKNVIDQLQPLLQPRLLQDGLPSDEVAPLLSKMHIDFLQTALTTANLQPVIVKLKAAAYQKPVLQKAGSSERRLQSAQLAQLQPVLLPHLQQMGRSWDDALAELKQMAEAELDGCLVSGCVAPIIEKLAMSQSAVSTPAASVAASDQDEKASDPLKSDADRSIRQDAADSSELLNGLYMTKALEKKAEKVVKTKDGMAIAVKAKIMATIEMAEKAVEMRNGHEVVKSQDITVAKSNDRMFSSPRMFQCPRKFNQEPKYLSPGPKYSAVCEPEAGAVDKGAEARGEEGEEGCLVQPSTQVHAREREPIVAPSGGVRLMFPDFPLGGSPSKAGPSWPRLLAPEELERVYAVPGNHKCADCARAALGPDGAAARPSWASSNLGVTLSPQAAGVHRCVSFFYVVFPKPRELR